MKPEMIKIVRCQAWLCAALLAVAATVHAFPPAPDHVIQGMVRTELGDPLSITNATVFLENASGDRISSAPVRNLEPGVNYRLTIPMDAGLTADAYQEAALHHTAPFVIKVKIGAVAYLPIQMQGDYAELGKPAQITKLDLTLGVDSTGDGLPDAWKRMILAMSNGYYTNINQIHPDGHFPENPMTFREAYIAGTYPWDLNEGFTLTVVGMNAGAPILEFFSVQDRSYTVFGTSDFKEWTPVPFRVLREGTTNPLTISYTATEVGKMRIEAPPQPGARTNRFFKAVVQ